MSMLYSNGNGCCLYHTLFLRDANVVLLLRNFQSYKTTYYYYILDFLEIGFSTKVKGNGVLFYRDFVTIRLPQ